MAKSETLAGDALGEAIEGLFKSGPRRFIEAFQEIMPHAYENEDAAAQARMRSRVAGYIKRGQLQKVHPNDRQSPLRWVEGGTPTGNGEVPPKRAYARRQTDKTPGVDFKSPSELQAFRKFLIMEIREKLDRLEKLG